MCKFLVSLLKNTILPHQKNFMLRRFFLATSILAPLISTAQIPAISPLVVTSSKQAIEIGLTPVSVTYNISIRGLEGTEKADIELYDPASPLIKGQDYQISTTQFSLTAANPSYNITVSFSGRAYLNAPQIFTLIGRWKDPDNDYWDDFYAAPQIVYYRNKGYGPLQPSISKDPLYLAYYSALLSKLQDYRCSNPKGGPKKPIQAVQHSVLDSNLSIVFSNVVLGSNDIIKTGIAASLAQDKDKGTLSFNTSILAKNDLHLWGYDVDGAGNIGFSAKTAGGIYQLFGKDSWSKEIGINGGYTFIPHTASQFVDTNDCEKLLIQRRIAASGILMKYDKILKEDISQLQQDSTFFTWRLMFSSRLDEYDTKTFVSDDSTLKSIISRLSDFHRIHDAALTSVPAVPDYDTVEDRVENDLAQFDLGHDILSGYKVWFYDFKGGILNNLLNLNTDSLLKPQKDPYTSRGLLKFNIQASANYTRLSNYNPNQGGQLYFLQFNALFERGSFLDVPGIVGKPEAYHSVTANDEIIINSDNQDTLGRGSELNIPVCTLTPEIYFAAFFGKGQQIGFDFRTSYRWVIDAYLGNRLNNTYSFLIGPVFRIATEKDFSKATFGIKTGLSNASVSSNRVWKDYFTIRFEIGVPFKWYYKETPASK